MATDSIAHPRVIRFSAGPHVTEFWLSTDISSVPHRLPTPLIDALREYFSRPKPLPPVARATTIIAAWLESGHVCPTITNGDMAVLIARAIEDAARRGVDWEEA